jgi:hypothetical protein
MNPTSACLYHVLDGNVHEFILTEASRQALDEMFDITEKQLRDQVTSGAPELARSVLVDCSVGFPPINYALVRVKSLMKEFPGQQRMRSALILPSGPLLKALSIMLRPITPVRIYMPEDREAALAWLRTATPAVSQR